MAFTKKGIVMSKEEVDVSSYRQSITSKVQELEENMLDVKDVSALKMVEFNLSKVYESTNEKKSVAT